jgi:hypothetical protein
MTPDPMLPGNAGPLVGKSHRECTAYLERVFAAPQAVQERAGMVVGLPELYRNLVLVELGCLAPGLLVRAYETIDALGCLACPHGRHKPGDCLVAVVVEDGRPGYCTCGAS